MENDKTNEELIEELTALRRRIAEPEAAAIDHKEIKKPIHDKLYRSQDLTRIDISDYIDDPAVELFRAYDIDPSFVLLENNIKKTYFDLDTAIPRCLIITAPLNLPAVKVEVRR
jgi:hypothetical protein